MQRTAAAKIDRGIVKSETAQEVDTAPRNPPLSTFQPYRGQRRKPGTGCISQINDHLWEGRYSPTVSGKRVARNVYACTEEECEKKTGPADSGNEAGNCFDESTGKGNLKKQRASGGKTPSEAHFLCLWLVLWSKLRLQISNRQKS